MDWQPLIRAATEARERAYAPYSDFRVGSALRTEDGTVVSGCNVENQSYGLTVCAERVAMQTAVCAGHRKVLAAVVLTNATPPSPPCGPCLSVLAEFGSPDLAVLLLNTQGEQHQHSLGELLPVPFALPHRDGE